MILVSYNRTVSIGPAITEELPGVAHLADLVHIEVGDDEFVEIARAFGEDLAAWVAEIALSVELADVPRCLGADAVDRPDEIAVSDSVCGLFEFPEVLA